MSGVVRIPRPLWDALPADGEGAAGLVRRLAARGRTLLGPARSAADPLPRLRAELARRAATALLLREDVLAARGRAAEATAWERRTYAEHLRLERDVVPPLKLHAAELRRRLRSLEAELSRRGVDPAGIGPPVPHDALAVEDYRPPRYRTPEERRRGAVELFRRLRA